MSKARELANLGNAYSDGALSNRNAVINGGFDVWQRGSPITNAGGGSYFSADRWKGYSGASRTFTQDTTSALSIGFKNCLKVVQGAAVSSFYNRIEDVRTYAGDTVTLSYWVKADAAHTTSFAYLRQNFGSGGSADVTVNMSTVDVGTSWQRVVKTVTLPSVEGKTIGSSSYLEVYPFPLSASQTYYITGVQLEVGDTATPFEHRSSGDELARCQRYFYKFPVASRVGVAHRYSVAGNVVFSGLFPVEMRATPTMASTGIPKAMNASFSANYSLNNIANSIGTDRANFACAFGGLSSGHGIGEATTMSLYDATLTADAEL